MFADVVIYRVNIWYDKWNIMTPCLYNYAIQSGQQIYPIAQYRSLT